MFSFTRSMKIHKLMLEHWPSMCTAQGSVLGNGRQSHPQYHLRVSMKLQSGHPLCSALIMCPKLKPKTESIFLIGVVYWLVSLFGWLVGWLVWGLFVLFWLSIYSLYLLLFLLWKKTTYKSNVRKGGFILVQSLRTQSIMSEGSESLRPLSHCIHG